MTRLTKLLQYHSDIMLLTNPYKKSLYDCACQVNGAINLEWII